MVGKLEIVEISIRSSAGATGRQAFPAFWGSALHTSSSDVQQQK